MVNCGEELICDFAETYRVYDIKSLDVEYAATLAVGLRDGSRVKMKLNGDRLPLSDLLLARISDATTWRLWQNTKDGHKGKNMPPSIFDILTGNDTKDKPIEFESIDDFKKVWSTINGD